MFLYFVNNVDLHWASLTDYRCFISQDYVCMEILSTKYTHRIYLTCKLYTLHWGLSFYMQLELQIFTEILTFQISTNFASNYTCLYGDQH